MNKRPTADDLARFWTRIGARFTIPPASEYLDPERLLVKTAELIPQDHRLFFVAATWIGTHYELLNARRFRNELLKLEGRPSAVSGALLSVALMVKPDIPVLNSALEHCKPLQSPEPLFEQYARSRVILKKVQSNCHAAFLPWGLWYDELSLKPGAIRPIQWIRKHCPELRIRELLGANLEADVILEVQKELRTVSDLSRILGTTYAATHEAVSRLIRRGLLVKSRKGNRRPLSIPQDIMDWFNNYPTLKNARTAYESGSTRYGNALRAMAGNEAE